MAKLTKAEKEAIINRAVKDVFEKKFQRLKEQEYKLSLEAYDSLYSQEEKDLIKKLPDRWLHHCTTLGLGYVDGSYRNLQFKNAVKVTYDIYNSSSSSIKDKLSSALNSKLTNLYDKKAALEGKERLLLKKLSALVMPITTDNKLVEVWPEGVKYMTPIDKSENLPSVTSKEVVDLMKAFSEEVDN